MGELPSSRVCPSRPFSQVGIDYAGPLIIKTSSRRNAPPSKCYIAIFICMATKAIHIEVISSLSSSAFLAALQRFVARRGLPSQISSDCETNFQVLPKELRRILSNSVNQNLFSHVIPCQWNFNPPATPHFGGLWEAAVKSMKHHLKRVIGTQILNFEEMCTLTQRVEPILNSRLITPQSTDPNDFRALTPRHFLIGAPLLVLPEHDKEEVPINRLTRWQLLDQFHHSIWKRLSTDYLRSLQVKNKWYKNQQNIKVGDLVLVHAPNIPSTHWKMGRIEDVHPGEDGIVRVVTISTNKGTLNRPVVKIAVLPISE